MSNISSPRGDDASPRGIRRLLGSVESQGFLEHGLGENMLYVEGLADRWDDLFSWHDLEAALNSGLVSYPRVRLIKQGEEPDPAVYTYERAGRQWPDSRRAQQLMAEGATLVMANVEGLTPRLDAFVRDLERDLSGGIRVDVVATTASVPGLKMHWDNAECFNLQLDGEKDWQVVKPARPYPLTATHRFPQRQDLMRTLDPPDGPTHWSGTMKRGALIYLPRGWWHAVSPRVSPSLHLSIAVDVPTLTDFLRWLALDAARHEFARRPLPAWEPGTTRTARLADAVRELQALISGEAVETYLSHITDYTPGRPAFVLPGAATPGGASVSGETMVRVESLGPLAWSAENGAVTVQWRGNAVKFPAAAAPALRALDERRVMTIGELAEQTNPTIAHVLAFTLLTTGLLTISPRPSAIS